ncbi:ATP-grasp domain-containing protein [Butyricimonas paravirosa]
MNKNLIRKQVVKNLYGKKLLILAGADVHIKIVKAARELGVYTIVTDYLLPEDSPAKRVADEYWMIDIMDVDAVVEKCYKEKVDGVLAFCIDPAQIPYQKICEKLGLPCYGTKEQFDILTNKRLFKDYCVNHGVEVVPEYNMSDIENNIAIYPVLVKPSDSRGSRGQSVCYNKDEIQFAIKRAREESKEGEVLIERYMLGKQDMSFAYIVINGMPYLLKIGDRYLGKIEDNLERQQIATILPSRNVEQYRRDVEPNVISMIKSLGIMYGAVFLQGFWENGHVYMYDPGMRFPGSDFDIVLKYSTGFDDMKSFVYFALTGDIHSQQGDPIDAYKLNGGVCIILSIAVHPGKIAVFEGLEKIASNNCVFSATQRYNVGDVILPSGDINQRVAEFVAYLPNKDSIQEFLSLVYENLKIIDDEGNDMIISKLEKWTI